MEILNRFIFLLTLDERKKAILLLIMIIIMAFLDTIGVASILPFMAVLTNSNLIETNIFLNTVFIYLNNFGVKTEQQFIFILGAFVFILLIISLIFKGFTTYAQTRFIQFREYSIGKRLIQGYLHQPYSWFLTKHSSNIGTTILSEVQSLIGGGMAPLMDLISKGLIAITLIILLIITDPKIAIIVGFSLGSAYILIFYFVRRTLNKLGKERLKNNHLRFTVVSEAFGAVKEIKITGLESNYINRFSKSAEIYAKTQSSSKLINQLPRLILEAIAFGGILLVILYIISQKGSFNSAIPIISLYVFAGYRLMPALQTIYASFTQLTFIGPSLKKLYEELMDLKKINVDNDKNKIIPKDKICLKNINFFYPGSSRVSIKNLNLNINARSSVGFIGSTGSGKSTLVDIMMGLLEPQDGSLEIDGKVIDKKNIRSWQRSIGYVPQNIFLFDDTVEANIAFGEDSIKIDKNKVEKVSKIANLHEFVINELPNKYQTTIGERGVRLSGGQRQRIGIARALYYDPQVLILDEATSALDNETEKAVMEAINNLGKNVTIILIAHRLGTVKMCDKIVVIEKGEIKNTGRFADLIKEKENFYHPSKD